MKEICLEPERIKRKDKCPAFRGKPRDWALDVQSCVAGERRLAYKHILGWFEPMLDAALLVDFKAECA
jgi:hypothetical protein